MKYPQYTLGLVTGCCLAALYFMAPAILKSFKQPDAPQPVVEPAEKHGTFTVVSEYKGCDLVLGVLQSSLAVYHNPVVKHRLVQVLLLCPRTFQIPTDSSYPKFLD